MPSASAPSKPGALKYSLNGKPIFLRGISLPEEVPVRGDRAFSQKDAETLMGWAKALNCNFVRLTHYPRNENMTRIADRMGLMVWSEIPVYSDIDWADPATLQKAQSQLRDMIARDHNRASVVLWSISNETPIKPARLRFLRQLAEDARVLDPTRLITAVINHVDDAAPDVRVLKNPLGQYLDVLGLNDYLGRDGRRAEDGDRMRWKIAWDKPLIMSEFEAESPNAGQGRSDEISAEKDAASLYQHQLNLLQKIPSQAGLSPWVPMDSPSQHHPVPGIQDYFNDARLVSKLGEHNQGYYVLQKFHREIEPAR